MLICKVCNESFDSSTRIPYILRCGHTFCKPCLDRSFATKGQFACLNCFFVSHDPGEKIINHIINDRSSYVDVVQPHRHPVGHMESHIKQFDPFGFSHKTGTSASKGDMMIEQDAKLRLKEKAPEYMAYKADAGEPMKCKMRLCKNQATVDGLCDKCMAGLNSVKKLKQTPMKSSLLGSPVRVSCITPEKNIYSSNSLKQSNFNQLGSKSCRRIDKGLSTVKRVGNSTVFDDQRCNNPSCNKPINKADPSSNYCGYICRSAMERN